MKINILNLHIILFFYFPHKSTDLYTCTSNTCTTQLTISISYLIKSNQTIENDKRGDISVGLCIYHKEFKELIPK